MVSGMKTDMIIADLFYAIILLFSPFLFFNQCGLSITDVNIHSTRVFEGGLCSCEAKAEVLASALHDVKFLLDFSSLFFFSFIMFSLISSVNSLQAPRWKVRLCICGFRAHFLQSKGYSGYRKET